MKNNRGQALVEFVIILPVFLLILISVIDLGNIILNKYSMENDVDVISDMYKENKRNEIELYAKEKNISVNYEFEEDLVNINLSKDINIISPILNVVFGKAYEINVEKSFYANEQ